MRNKTLLNVFSCFTAAVVLTAFSSCRAVIKRDSDKAWEYLTNTYRDDVFELTGRTDSVIYFSSKKLPGEKIKVNMKPGRAPKDNYLYFLYGEEIRQTLDGFLTDLLGENGYYLLDRSDGFTRSGNEKMTFEKFMSTNTGALKYRVYVPFNSYGYEDFIAFQNAFYDLAENYNIAKNIFEFRFADERDFKDLRDNKIGEGNVKPIAIYSYRTHTSKEGQLDNGWEIPEDSLTFE